MITRMWLEAIKMRKRKKSNQLKNKMIKIMKIR